MGILKKIVFMLIVIFSISSIAHAQGILGGNGQGQIDFVDLNERKIIIGDWVFNLALDLKVYSKHGNETDFALKQGRQVKYEINPHTAEQGVTTIVNVWLLED